MFVSGWEGDPLESPLDKGLSAATEPELKAVLYEQKTKLEARSAARSSAEGSLSEGRRRALG